MRTIVIIGGNMFLASLLELAEIHDVREPPKPIPYVIAPVVSYVDWPIVPKKGKRCSSRWKPSY